MWTGLFAKARNIIRAYPSFYRLYLKLRGHSVEFPGPRTLLHITGYPRSANTSTLFIFREFLPDERLTHHNHTVADLKIARRHGVDTLVMLREPLEAISSHVVKRRHQPETQHALVSRLNQAEQSLHLQMALHHYVQYYRHVERHADGFILGDFEKAVSDPVAFVGAAADALSFELDWSPEGVERGRARYRRRKAETDEERSETAGLPDAAKERRKDTVKSELENSLAFRKARELYEKLQPEIV